MIPISFNLCFNILVNQAVPGHMSHRGLLECFTVTGFPRVPRTLLVPGTFSQGTGTCFPAQRSVPSPLSAESDHLFCLPTS